MLERRAAVLPVALFAILGFLAPIVAHALGGACWVYLPAHFPALLAGLSLGPLAGGLVALATGVAELFAVDGEPGARLRIAVEILVYGLAAGAFSRPGAGWTERLVALVTAMLLGRVVHLGFASLQGMHPRALLGPLFADAWPGIWIQIFTLPWLAYLVERWTGAAGAAPLAIPPASAETPSASRSTTDERESG